MSQPDIQPVYSWYGTPLHLPLSEDSAAAYNRRIQQFFDAQEHHFQTTGQRWDERSPLWMEKDDEAQEVWDKVSQIINLCVDLCGGSIGGAFSEEEMQDGPDGFILVNQ